MNSFKTFGLLLAFTASVFAETRLTFDGNNKRDPVFINEGKNIVYAYDETDDLIRAVKIDLENLEAQPEPLFDEDRSHQTEIAFSPDGRYTAFSECTGNLTGKLVIRNLEENKQFEIKHGGRGAYRTPTFSPDGQRVIYAFAETGPMQLWSVDLEAKDKKQVTETEGLTHWPSFTPDGKRIVFANTRENNYEIYIRDFATVEKQDDKKKDDAKSDDTEQAPQLKEERLTNNRLMDIRPRVSPDGKRICFVSTRDGNYEVYVMNIDGTEVRRVSENEERDDYPTWHPDSQQLVYVSERNGRMDLYLVDLRNGLSE